MRRILCLMAIAIFRQVLGFNGELVEADCPYECDCHYFRVNLVTDCSESNLTDIPYNEISEHVYILDLNGNYITDVLPFPPDIKLRRIQLADNFMTRVNKESFAGLTYLIDADFANNKITVIDPHTFENSAGFITLELQDNPLSPVKGAFLYSNTLLFLDISNCNLDSINPHFFENITSLSTLDLSDNPLKQIGQQEFYALTSLQILKLNNCKLTSIHIYAFSSLGNLRTLEIARNAFAPTVVWTSVLSSLIRLEYLDMRNSSILHLPENVFSRTSYLRTLILAENDLKNFDVAASIGENLSHLENLDLSHCHLSTPLSEEAFMNAGKLRSLYLSGNTLFASDLLVALSPLKRLQKLSLSHCGLSVLPDTLHKFKSLTDLDISHNPLNDVFVKILAPLKYLEYLNMGYSNLSYISPTTFSKMTSMKRLILSGNDLNSLEAGLFGNLTHLESLELNSCGLRRPLNARVFFNNLTYTDLTELQLSGNPLTVPENGPLLPKQLSRLQKLDLSNCNLTYLPPDAFSLTQNLTELVLKGNQFSSSDDMQFLQPLVRLEMLDLRNNNLSMFSRKDILSNSSIHKLKLVGNPWKCECSIVELWNWAMQDKSDLGVLEGATATAEDITVGKTKRKNLLICNYDTSKPNLSANKSPTGRRPFIKPKNSTATNRTWAKYVRESGCEQTPSPRSARSVKLHSVEEELLTSAKHVQNYWASHLINATIVYVIGMAIIYALYVVYKVKLSPKPQSPYKNS